MRHSVARAAALVAAAALAAGCGDDGDETGAPPTTAVPPSTQVTTTTPAPPRSEYAEEADEICGRYQQQIDEIPAPATDAELVAAMEQTVPLVRAQIAELRKLTPPAGLSATGGNFISALERTAESLELLVSSTKAGDAEGAQQAVVEGDNQTDRARRLARKLGMTVCGAER